MRKLQSMMLALILIAGTGTIMGCNRADVGQSGVREEPVIQEREAVEGVGELEEPAGARPLEDDARGVTMPRAAEEAE